MSLDNKNKIKILKMISVARKALSDLEAELEPSEPASRRVNPYKAHAQEAMAMPIGTWKKPPHLKKAAQKL